ncbi:hypothetical protein N0V93_003530 [Gnomoniopsis smithogilvyi]|uniref:Ankyrin repeat protein n=1 Tax=Gnomoniopsis smithogilvyi TaxID=1191159 RepID=A0A9W8YYR5_9PEZI|nr:hypothetical protein N0V93_003530 [Gnomoniopsis smithogilvyi]
MGNCVAFLESVLEHGADIDKCNNLFSTPLHLACARDLPGIMALRLIELGADVWMKNKDPQVSYLSTLAFNRLGTMSLPIIEQMVQRGCTYELSPFAFTYLYWMSVRENDLALQNFFLSQEGVSREGLEEKTPIGSLLVSLIMENMTSTIAPIKAIVNKISVLRQSLIVNEARNSVFHVLASGPELSRNEALNERLADIFMNSCKQSHDTDIVNLVNSRGQTALTLAVLNANHSLLRLLLRNGADPSLGKYSMYLCFLSRLERELLVFENRPGPEKTLAENLKWQQKLSRMHKNTMRVLCIALEYLTAIDELKPIAPQQEKILVSTVIKQWRQKTFYESMEIKSIRDAVGEHVAVEIEGTRHILREPDGGERSLSPAEGISGMW